MEKLHCCGEDYYLEKRDDGSEAIYDRHYQIVYYSPKYHLELLFSGAGPSIRELDDAGNEVRHFPIDSF